MQTTIQGDGRAADWQLITIASNRPRVGPRTLYSRSRGSRYDGLKKTPMKKVKSVVTGIDDIGYHIGLRFSRDCGYFYSYAHRRQIIILRDTFTRIRIGSANIRLELGGPYKIVFVVN